jgi:aryl-alcohol dehydrogenase-like predicted oxidoreductase
MNFGGTTNEEDSFAIMRKSVDSGINFFDTANVYTKGESERITGMFLKENKLRDRIVLATKVFGRVGDLPNDAGGTRYHMIKACEDSLQRLQTDHIDLYQLHRPPLTHSQEETLRAFDDLIRAGKVRYIGCSTHPAWMVMEAIAISERYGLNRYISEQPPYNLLDRRIENELVPLCQKYDLAILPWSPLAMGLLAGRYAQTDTYPEDSRARLWDSSQVWTKDQPGVTAPIIGPRTLAHLEDALVIMEKKFDEADRPLFDKLVHPGTAVSDFHNSNDWMKARILS